MATDSQIRAARAAGYLTPGPTDLVSEGDDAISHNAAITHERIADLPDLAKRAVRSLGAYAGHLDDAKSAGQWQVFGTGILARGGPVDGGGILVVLEWGAAPRQLYYVGADVWTRQSTSGGWGAWTRVGVQPGAVRHIGNLTAHVDEAREPGRYLVWGSLASGYGLPITTGGVLEVFQYDKFPFQVYYTPGKLFMRNLTLSGWGPWKEIGAAPPPPPPPASATSADAGTLGARRATRVADALNRIGGRIGTGGRAVVMVRMDDYPRDMLDKVIPLMEKYDIPASWAATVRHAEELDQVPWADLDSAAVQHGLLMTGHSWSHGQATTPEAIHKEVVESADYFEQVMPSTRVDVWTMPGTGATSPYDGYHGQTAGDISGTLAGRLLWSRYAVVNGRRPGYLVPQGGPDQSLLASHLTIEAIPYATFKTAVDEAVAQQSQLNVMFHPMRMDTEGYNTTAQIEAMFAYLAAERAAGRVMVLSMLSQLSLDPTSQWRHDALATNISTGPSGWTGGTWASSTLSVAAGATVRKSVHPDRVAGVRGSVREFVVTVRSAVDTTVTLAMSSSRGTFNVTKSYPVVGGQRTTLRKFLTVPYNLGNEWITASITAPASLEVTDIHAYAS